MNRWYRSVYGPLAWCYLVAFVWYCIAKKRREAKMGKIILEHEKSQSVITDHKVEEISTAGPVVKRRKVRIAFPPLIKRFPYSPGLSKSQETHRVKKRGDVPASVKTSTQEMKIEMPTVFIATNTSVPASLRKTWKRIECVSVSAYFQTLSRAVAELKWEVNRTRTDHTTDMELLLAFGSAVKDRNKTKNHFVSACNLLMSELEDMDTAFRDPDAEDDW